MTKAQLRPLSTAQLERQLADVTEDLADCADVLDKLRLLQRRRDLHQTLARLERGR